MEFNPIGYGPRHRLVFDGDESKYGLWEVKFLGHMRLKKLDETISPSDPADAADAEKNRDAFAELVQLLDDKSLSLVIRGALNDGRKALTILREHYIGQSKPRIIALYNELTTLVKKDGEDVTDYVIRAEKASTALKAAEEVVSDGLLVAMALKGLPADYQTFVAVTSQRDTQQTFQEFKVSLKSYEEHLKCSPVAVAEASSVMTMQPSRPSGAHGGQLKCYRCGGNHKKVDCTSNRGGQRKNKKWCDTCRTRTHDTKECRRKDAAKISNDADDHSFVFTVHSQHGKDSEAQLLVDCGATTHIVNDSKKFVNFDPNFNAKDHVIELADGSRTSNVVSGRGNARVVLYDASGRSHDVILRDALCVPSYKQDILSVQAATSSGASITFEQKAASMMAQDGTKFDIEKSGRLYYLNSVSMGVSKQRSLYEWHRILGHCNVRDIVSLQNVADGIKVEGSRDWECNTCTRGKMIQTVNRTPDRKATKPMEFVHCDLAGPVTPVAREGFKYAICFVDDYSGANFVYFLKQKSDTVEATKRFLADCAPYGCVKRLRSDNGTEFTSKQFDSLMIDKQICHETSAPYSPHQNGTVERSWRTLFAMARCLLLESKLPKFLWTYAVLCSAYIRNRCYNPRTQLTAYECLTGKRPNLSNMSLFGSVCFAYDQIKSKLESRCTQGLFVGYDRQSPAYLVYFPENKTIKRVRCVKFTNRFEHQMNCDVDHYECDIVQEKVETDGTEGAEGNAREPVMETEAKSDTEGAEGEEQSPEIPVRPKRERRPPKYLSDYVTNTSDDSVDYFCKISDVPRTYEEAVSSPDSVEWQNAMEEEMLALKENQTFELVSVPKGQNVVGGKWVFAVKSEPGKPERYKARYVARGFSQKPGVDYQETFSPTARLTSVRMLMQLAASEDLVVHQMDVKTAYLHAPLDCEIYMKQPQGFEESGENDQKQVYKLNKALYGLKQSGRMWNQMLHAHLINDNFVQSSVDHCVYVKTHDGCKVIILVWVDDIIIAANNQAQLAKVKISLGERFRMKDLGVLSWFLGIKFVCSENSIVMNQSKYVENMLHRFNMSDCKPKSTPCDPGCCKSIDGKSPELSVSDALLYREIVGSLIYLMTASRPDISFVVTKLSQFMSKPLQIHMGMAKHMLRYLKGTQLLCLKFNKIEGEPRLFGYCDSDWAGSEDRKSISGYCFMMRKGGPLISWRSCKQQCVALSTCEAEYVSLACAVQEAKFLSQLLCDMCNSSSKPTMMNVDNQSAIALATNPVSHKRSKHIDIKYHFVRQEVLNGSVVLEYVETEKNVADVFTKPVSRYKMNVLSLNI